MDMSGWAGEGEIEIKASDTDFIIMITEAVEERS